MDNKRYYWIKLKTDFFNQEAIDFLMSQENGCEYIVLYQMLCLQTANNQGELATRIGEMIVPYDAKKIVRDTKYFDIDTVMVALELFKKLGLVYVQEDNTLKISNYEEMVGSESSSAQRVREHRKRKVLQSNNSALQSNKKVTQEIEIDKEIENRDRDKRIETDKETEKADSKETSGKGSHKKIYYPLDERIDDALRDFVDMRKKMRKPMTDRAIDLAIKKLEGLAKDAFGSMDNDKAIEIINQSIEHGWQTFYPLKENGSQKRSDGSIDWDNV